MAEHTDMQDMVNESKKKTAQVATAGILGGVVILVMLWGMVKFYPVTSQLTLLVNDVERQKNQSANTMEKVAEIKDMVDTFQRSDFPVIEAAINQRLTKLDDIAGDNDTKVQQIDDAVELNTKANELQLLRATRRIEQHKARDERDERTIERVNKIEKRLEDFQTDQIQLLIKQMEELHQMIKNLKEKSHDSQTY